MKFPAYLRPDRVVPDVQPGPTTPADDRAVMWFLTLGGAEVELRSYRFKTSWDPVKGRPYALDHTYETSGYAWKCLGCDTASTDYPGTYDDGYLRSEKHLAREHANEHAHDCRAMPKPETAR